MSSVEMAHVGYSWPELRTRITAAWPLTLADQLAADMAAAQVGDPTYADPFESAFSGRGAAAEAVGAVRSRRGV